MSAGAAAADSHVAPTRVRNEAESGSRLCFKIIPDGTVEQSLSPLHSLSDQ